MKIYLDLDGVLAECHYAALAYYGVMIDEWPRGIYTKQILAQHGVSCVDGLTTHEFWATFDEQFWATLKKSALCDCLVDLCASRVGTNNVFVASRPTMHPGSWSGKYIWVLENLPTWIHNQVALITFDKSSLAKPGAVLVDDTLSNTVAFEHAGGVGIPVPRAWNGNFDDDSYVIDRVSRTLEKMTR